MTQDSNMLYNMLKTICLDKKGKKVAAGID